MTHKLDLDDLLDDDDFDFRADDDLDFGDEPEEDKQDFLNSITDWVSLTFSDITERIKTDWRNISRLIGYLFLAGLIIPRIISIPMVTVVFFGIMLEFIHEVLLKKAPEIWIELKTKGPRLALAILTVIFIVYEWRFISNFWKLIMTDRVTGTSIIAVALCFGILIWAKRPVWNKVALSIGVALVTYQMVPYLLGVAHQAFHLPAISTFITDENARAGATTALNVGSFLVVLLLVHKKIMPHINGYKDALALIAIIGMLYFVPHLLGVQISWIPTPEVALEKVFSFWDNIYPQLGELGFKFPTLPLLG